MASRGDRRVAEHGEWRVAETGDWRVPERGEDESRRPASGQSPSVAKVQAMLMARMASRSPLLVLFLRQENKIIVLYGPVLGR